MSKGGIEIPGDLRRDQRLHRLATDLGFGTVNRLLAHVANEVSHCKNASEFYRACAALRDGQAKMRKPLTRAQTASALLAAVRILKRDTPKS